MKRNCNNTDGVAQTNKGESVCKIEQIVKLIRTFCMNSNVRNHDYLSTFAMCNYAGCVSLYTLSLYTH